MAFIKHPIIHSEALNFDDLLDDACDRLWEKHVKYSIRRIDQLEQELNRLEKEIEEFRFAFTENT